MTSIIGSLTSFALNHRNVVIFNIEASKSINSIYTRQQYRTTYSITCNENNQYHFYTLITAQSTINTYHFAALAYVG